MKLGKGEFDDFKTRIDDDAFKSITNLIIYNEQQLAEMESVIAARFGAFEKVFHEIESQDIHVDIAVIPPTEDKPYYTLVTMGLSAYKMHTPHDLDGQNLEYAEIFVRLPADWQVGEEDENWYWPIRTLKMLAHLPFDNRTWLGWGHTIQCSEDLEPVSENCKFVCMILKHPNGNERATATLESGKIINFYEMIPIYLEEMKYKFKIGAEYLFELFTPEELTSPVNIKRRNVVTE